MALPTADRLLLGPGPSPVSARVQAALAAPPRSHLDPDMVALLDDSRARLARVFRTAEDTATLAVSGTGSAGMETVVPNEVPVAQACKVRRVPVSTSTIRSSSAESQPDASSAR